MVTLQSFEMVADHNTCTGRELLRELLSTVSTVSRATVPAGLARAIVALVHQRRIRLQVRNQRECRLRSAYSRM